MLNIFFDAGALESGTNVETKTETVAQPLVSASETNEARKKLLDDAIQNGGLALTEQFSKSVTKSVVEDIDKDTRVGGAIDLATDTLKDLEVASNINNYSTAVLDKVILPSINQFNETNVDNLDYSDLKFYTSLFVTENGKGPIAVSIDNYINKNFQKNADGTYSSKQSWEKFSKGVGGNGVFQLIKQLDAKLGELSGFSHSDLQKADIENIRKFLKPYVDIANANSFDPKLIESVQISDPATSQNINDFMTRNQEYGISLYGQNVEQQIHSSPANVVWDEQNQRYINNPNQTPEQNTTPNVVVAPVSSQPVANESSDPVVDSTPVSTPTQPSSTVPEVATSQPTPDPLNDINHNVVGTQVSGALSQLESTYSPQQITNNPTDATSQTSSNPTDSINLTNSTQGTQDYSPISQTEYEDIFSPSPTSGGVLAQDLSDSQPTNTSSSSDQLGSGNLKFEGYTSQPNPNYPLVDVSSLNLIPEEGIDKPVPADTGVVVTPQMRKDFEEQSNNNGQPPIEQTDGLQPLAQQLPVQPVQQTTEQLNSTIEPIDSQSNNPNVQNPDVEVNIEIGTDNNSTKSASK